MVQGVCWPIFCSCLSVSLRPVALHSPEKLESCLLSVWIHRPVPAPSGLRFFTRTVPFLLHKGPPVQHSRPTEFHALSGPVTLYKPFPQPAMPFPSFYASVLRNFLLQEVFLNLPELCLQDFRETIMSSQQY